MLPRRERRRGYALRVGTLVIALAAALIAPASAGAAIDLSNSSIAIRVHGANSNDNAASALADVGDINGDGRNDFAVGAPNADPDGRTDAGAVYVIYGGPGFASLSSIDLKTLGAGGSQGLEIDGAAAGDNLGASVAGGGDLNGDGIDDLVIGAPLADGASGSAYVIYGQKAADRTDVDLASITTTQSDRGMQIDGAGGDNEAGHSVSAGDLNGDGIDDLVLGALGAGDNSRDFSGSVYVIYGQKTADPTDVDLANITTSQAGRGMRIDGADADDDAGTSVADAGDVNGDEIDDLVLGAPGAAENSRAFSGSAYVIYGKQAADPTDVDLASITSSQAGRGMRIDGAAADDGAGASVAGAGDINGDGIDDMVIGANGAGNNSRAGSGSAYVIYGKQAADPTDIDLASITSSQAGRGIRIDGAAANDHAGTSVTGGGDLNGDGIDDLVIGAPGADNNSRTLSGSAYVINGEKAADPTDIDLASITTSQAGRGIRIDGAVANDGAGAAVAGSEDINGDGHPDLLVGAPNSDVTTLHSRPDSGTAYFLDLGPPVTKISGPNDTSDTTPSFTFTTSEPASFECSIDEGNAAFDACSGPGQTDIDFKPLDDGHYTFHLKATDAYGNAGITSKAFTIDTKAPQTKITKHPKPTLHLKRHKHSAKARFAFSSSEKGSTFECSIDGDTAKPCRSPETLRLKAGKHMFSVTATDAAGNTDPTPVRFKLKVKAAKPRR